MDELKKYLQQHAHEMDLDEPSPGLSQRIISAGNASTKTTAWPLRYNIAAAASVVLLLVLGIRYFSSGPGLVPGVTQEGTSKAVSVKENNIPAASLPVTDGIDTSVTKDAASAKVPVSGNPANDSEPYRLLSSFESHYSKMVNLQLQSIRQSPLYGEPAGYFDDLKSQLMKITGDEAAVKMNIQHTGLTDALLSQLITVYEQKIGLLKNIQAEINRINQKVKENHQPGDSLLTSYVNI